MRKVWASIILILAMAAPSLAGPIVSRRFTLNATTTTSVCMDQRGLGINFHVLRWNSAPGMTAGTVGLARYTNSTCTANATDIIAATTATSSGTSATTTSVANFVMITVASYAGLGSLEVWYGGYIDIAAGISGGAGTAGEVAFFDSAVTLDGDAGFTYIAATDTGTIGALIANANGAASLPKLSGVGTWFTGGSATTTKPYLLIEPTGTTSTGWSTSGTGIGVNAASGFTGNLIDLQVAGVSKFSVSPGQVFVSDGTAALPGISFGSDTNSGFRRVGENIVGASMGGTDRLIFTVSGLGIGTAAFDATSTNTLALLNGTAPTTSPADTVKLFSADISAGNASLGIRTETAVAADIETESTHTLSVTINGTIYKILLATP